MKCPIAILGAEIDNLAPPELVKKLGEILTAKSDQARMVIEAALLFELNLFEWRFLCAG